MSPTPTPAREEQDLIERGKKCLALSDWEGAGEHYAKVLELARTRLASDTHPSMAPLLLPYGKALVEIAIASQGVLGRDGEDAEGEGDEEEDEEEAGPSTSKPSASTSTPAQPTSADQPEEEMEEEDDFTIAWEILDLARTLYERRAEEDGEDVGRELGECLGLLGDVSLEGENFPQAAQDYKSALEAYTSSLPLSAREIASSHLKLAIALENIPSKRSEAMDNVVKAIESVKARKSGLKQGLEVDKAGQAGKGKGKGKVESEKEGTELSDEERGRKVKDCQELLVDLEAKLEDLRTSPQQRDVVEESVAHLLGNTPGDIATAAIQSSSNVASQATATASTAIESATTSTTAKVNDLTGMVRRKGKKTVDQASVEAGKGKQAVVQTTEQVGDQAAQVGQEVVEAAKAQADKAKEVVLEKGEKAFDVASEQAGVVGEKAGEMAQQALDAASAQAEVVGEKASEVAQQALDAASEATQQAAQVVSAQASQAMDVAADQAAGFAQTISETTTSLATSAQDAIVDAAEQAQSAIAESEILQRANAQLHAIKDQTVRLVSPATFDALLDGITTTASNVIDEIVSEGKEMTRQNVDAVGSVVHDLDTARTRATDFAGEVKVNAVELGKEAYDKAVEQGRAVVDEIMEEGKGMTREGVESVAGVVEDVLGGLEKAGREGKRKVEEVVPEPVVEQEEADSSRRAKKQKTA